MKRGQSNFILTKITICSLFLAFSSPLVAQDYDDGWNAYESGNYEEALSILLPLAEQGDATAQTVVGYIYIGSVSPEAKEFQDFDQAAKWFRKAAEQGYSEAQVQLSAMYCTGKGVTTDYVKCYMWLILASNQGHEIAPKLMFKLKRLIISLPQIEEAQVLARDWEIKPSTSEPE